ncbi:hypothetical protein TRAPUB_989, partial [Trametes pubescens]
GNYPTERPYVLTSAALVFMQTEAACFALFPDAYPETFSISNLYDRVPTLLLMSFIRRAAFPRILSTSRLRLLFPLARALSSVHSCSYTSSTARIASRPRGPMAISPARTRSVELERRHFRNGADHDYILVEVLQWQQHRALREPGPADSRPQSCCLHAD